MIIFMVAFEINRRNNKDKDCQNECHRRTIPHLIASERLVIQIEYNCRRTVIQAAARHHDGNPVDVGIQL